MPDEKIVQMLVERTGITKHHDDMDAFPNHYTTYCRYRYHPYMGSTIMLPDECVAVRNLAVGAPNFSVPLVNSLQISVRVFQFFTMCT